jgi:hypothetical protein
MESEQALEPGQSGKLRVPSGIWIVTISLLINNQQQKGGAQ